MARLSNKTFLLVTLIVNIINANVYSDDELNLVYDRIIKAVEKNDIDTIKKIYKSNIVTFESKTQWGILPYELAINVCRSDGLCDVFKWMTKESCNLFQLSDLSTAVILQDDETITKKVTDNSQINLKDKLGYAPLAYVCGKKAACYAKLLIDYGADCRALDNDGSSYIFNLPTEAIEVLLECGADPNTRDAQGWTLLMRELFPEVPDEDSMRVIKLLLDYGADPNALYNNCTTLGRLKWMYEIDNWEEYLEKGEGFAPAIKLIMSYGGKAECYCEDITPRSTTHEPEKK